MTDLVQRARQYLTNRKRAYCRVFTLESRDAVLVLEDLARFCRAHETTFHADARAHALAEGRREVWLRIARHLDLTDEQLWKLHPEAKGEL